MPHAIRNGISIHYQELGNGPPVVMIHGLFVGNMATWYFTSATIIAKTHRVLLYDLRGHGRSERPASGYDPVSMASDLDALVHEFSDEPLTLVGHSYGAVVALTYATLHPERVHKLAIVEAPLPPSRLEELNAFRRRTPEEMLDALPPPLRDSFARQGRQSTRFVQAMRQLVRETSMLEDVRAAGDFSDEALAAIQCPVLCVYGTRSSCLPVGERLAKAIPNAQLVTLEGGHFLPIEASTALTECLVAFTRE